VENQEKHMLCTELRSAQEFKAPVPAALASPRAGVRAAALSFLHWTHHQKQNQSQHHKDDEPLDHFYYFLFLFKTN
jgi:hypothetical protein